MCLLEGLYIIYWGYGAGNIAYETTTIFSKHIYWTRTFLTETKNCSGSSWWLYLSGKMDILRQTHQNLDFIPLWLSPDVGEIPLGC